MRKGEATRLRILDAAARQAAARGLTGVSLADVAEAVGLSKSGAFKHFASKEAMQIEVIELVMTRFEAFVWTAVEALPRDVDWLLTVFDRWILWEEEWPGTGCPMNAFIRELDDQPGPPRDFLQGRLQAFRARAIAEIRRIGDPPLSEDGARAAYFQMRSFVLGHSDASRMMGDADAPSSARAAFQAMLERTVPVAA
jgi:AcrR family transcriptional regulator